MLVVDVEERITATDCATILAKAASQFNSDGSDRILQLEESNDEDQAEVKSVSFSHSTEPGY
jgi:hypothetical protein